MGADWFAEALVALQSRAGLRFRDGVLLRQALTHPSLANESGTPVAADNQRLEFLGDAVLSLVVAEWLYDRFPQAREGELTGLRAYVVRTDGLAGFARDIGLGAFLRMGRGESGSGGAQRAANLCDGFEALVGALYIDQGLDGAREWVKGFLTRHAHEIDQQRTSKDAKTELQEQIQGHLRSTPTYRITRVEGPDHARMFTAEVLLEQQVVGEGCGSSKQAAEQAAAEAALRSLGRTSS